MSSGYRNGAFALGLIVGIGLALNLFLWLDYQSKQHCKNNSDSCQPQDDSQVGTIWDGIIGTFVSPSDTLAQWVMAFFTIAATGVLVLTLRSANKTNIAAIKAAEAAQAANVIAQRVARDQMRPVIVLEEPEVVDFQVGRPLQFKISIENVGQQAALRVSHKGKANVFPNMSTGIFFGDYPWMLGETIARRPKNLPITDRPVTQEMMDAVKSGQSVMRFGIVVRYQDATGRRYFATGRLNLKYNPLKQMLFFYPYRKNQK